MINVSWNDLNNEFKSILLIVFGTVLLMHTLDLLQQWLNWILIIFSLGMIVSGLAQLGIITKMVALVRKTLAKNQNKSS